MSDFPITSDHIFLNKPKKPQLYKKRSPELCIISGLGNCVDSRIFRSGPVTCFKLDLNFKLDLIIVNCCVGILTVLLAALHLKNGSELQADVWSLFPNQHWGTTYTSTWGKCPIHSLHLAACHERNADLPGKWKQ